MPSVDTTMSLQGPPAISDRSAWRKTAPELSIRVTQVEVNMKLTVGKRYTIEASKNMVDWVQAGELFTAEEQFKAMKFDVWSSPKKVDMDRTDRSVSLGVFSAFGSVD